MSQADMGLAQSIQARVVAHAKKLRLEPTLVFARYGLERFLYRLSRSRYAERFVLKGGMLMISWLGETVRTTRDADLLGYGLLTRDEILRIFQEVASVPGDLEDGVVFLPATVAVSPIRRADPYGGERVTFEGRIGRVKLSLQVDVAVGDAVYPPPEWLEYPSLLDVSRPLLRAYQPETTIAEKLHAIVELGQANTRMKDFFDIAELSRVREFEGTALGQAIRETFERRKTPLVAAPAGLSNRFGTDPGKQRQWEAFVSKNHADASQGFEEWVLRVELFVGPVLAALSRGEGLEGSWPAGGPWRSPTGERGAVVLRD